MTTPTREDLLGFVLGALEAEEHQQVADCLQSHPKLQLELQRIKAQIAPLQRSQQTLAEFPVGLARRTCEIVARECRLQRCHVADEPIPVESATPRDQPQLAAPTGTQFSRTRRIQATIMVCCAAVLGGGLGPMALRFTQAFADSMAANSAIAAVCPLPTSSETATARSFNNLLNDSSDIAIPRAKTRNGGKMMPDSQATEHPSLALVCLSNPQQVRQTLAKCQALISDSVAFASSPSVIPLGRPSVEPMFIADSISLDRSVGQRNGWEPWANGVAVESWGSDMTDSLSQIGSRPLIDTFSQGVLGLDAQLIAN